MSANYIFLTFGGGQKRYISAAKRLNSQAIASCKFDWSICETSKTLTNHHRSFFREFRDFARENPRGYGLWGWKPYLVEHYLKKNKLGDFLIYADAGCHLNLSNVRARLRLSEYYEMARSRGILAMHLRENQFKQESSMESAWTSRSLCAAVGLEEQDLRSPQIQATLMIIYVSEFSREVISSWNNLATTSNRRFLLGPENTEDCFDDYIEYREDQSVLSAIMKSCQIQTIEDESWFNPHWASEGSNYPFWAMRDRSARAFDILDHTKLGDYLKKRFK